MPVITVGLRWKRRECRVFKPATHNALLDILLSRGVNGESPSKRRKSRKSIVPIRRESESPTVQRRKSLKSRGEEQGEPEDEAGPKGKGKATGRRKSVAPRKRKSVAPRAKKVAEEDSEGGQPVAGKSICMGYMRVYMMVSCRPVSHHEGRREDDEA